LKGGGKRKRILKGRRKVEREGRNKEGR